MTQVERAVERGRGPSKLKDSFFVEDIARLPTPQHSDDFDGPHAWACRLQHRNDIICCWWLLRGIEAAAGSYSFGADGVHHAALHQNGHRWPLRDPLTPMLLLENTETLSIPRSTTTHRPPDCTGMPTRRPTVSGSRWTRWTTTSTPRDDRDISVSDRGHRNIDDP